jgi:hypothetical protein
MNSSARKAAVIFVCALALSLLLEWLYRIYGTGSAPGPDSPPKGWFVYSSKLVTYLVRSLPAFLAGFALKRSGFFIGAVVGMSSEILQLVLYVWQYPPPITWPVFAISVSQVCVYCIIGAVAGAAGQLAAQQRSDRQFKPPH